MDTDRDWSAPAPPRRGLRARTILILVLLAMVLGAVAMLMAISRWGLPQVPWQIGRAGAPTTPAGMVAANPWRIGPGTPATAANLAEADARILDLEGRLTRLRVASDAGIVNASRAEALLVAAATRRVIERGQPLGYLAGPVERLFGTTQPAAVHTLEAAAAAPVTQGQLAAGLDEIGDRLTGDGGNFWDRMRRQATELFVLRRAGTPSPAPSQRLKRARRFLTEGNVDAAVAEVERMPGRGAGNAWLDAARRYQASERALDVIEAEAIMAPAPAPLPQVYAPSPATAPAARPAAPATVPVH